MSDKILNFERRIHPAAACVVLALWAFGGTLHVRGAVIPRLDRGETLNIAAIGTSLTAEYTSDPNWFAQTKAWLSTKYPGHVNFSNRAVAGTASANLPQYGRPHGGPWQLDQVLAYDNPDVLFIEFAINDAAKLFEISVEQSRNNLGALITTADAWAAAHRKQLDIIVQTTNNTGPACEASYHDVGPYYLAWREEAAERNVLLIDHYPNWVDLYQSEPDHAAWNSYVPDDLHPNGLGTSMVIMPEIQRVLTSHAPEPSTTVLFLMGTAGLLFYRWRARNRYN